MLEFQVRENGDLEIPMTLLYLTLAWAGGILLSHLLWSWGAIGCGTPAWPIAVASGTTAIVLILLRQKPRARLISGMALFLLMGMWRYDVHPLDPCPTPTNLAFYNEELAEVEGIIAGYPDERATHTNYILSVETLTVAGQARLVGGQLLLQARPFPAYRYGDRLRATGRLREPPVFDDFDYRSYLARREIYSLMRPAKTELIASGQGSPFWAVIYGLRARGASLLGRVLPEPAAALANGMLLGIEGGIPADLYDAYRRAGVAHIIVISGSNISLLAGVLAFLIALPFGRRRAAMPVIAGVLLYVVLAGAQPPAVRAGLMAVLLLVAILLGRQSTAWVALVAVALCMSILNPLILWDASFQLSFMATLGLILFTPPMSAGLERWLEHQAIEERARRWIRLPAGLLIATLAAQLLVTPLMLYYFRQLSLVSIPANLLVLPAQPPVMAGGMATLVGGMIWEPAGRVLAAIPWLFLSYTNAVVRAAASIPLASVDTPAASALLVLLFYGVLFGILARGWKAPAVAGALYSGGRTPIPAGRAVAWAAAVTVPLWLGLSVLGGIPDGRLHMTYAANEAGESVLVVTPSGRRLRIGDLAPQGLRLPATDARGRPGLLPQPPEVVISPGASAPAETGIQWIDPTLLAPGTVIKTGDGVMLTRLDAGEGWALRLRFGEFRTLLPPKLSQESQVALLDSPGNELYTSLLKTPGPSSRAWLSPDFLAATAPQRIIWPELAVYPPGVEAWLNEHSALRVAEDTGVEIITDGQRMWLRQTRGSDGR